MSDVVFQGIVGHATDSGGAGGTTLVVTVSSDVAPAGYGAGFGSVVIAIAVTDPNNTNTVTAADNANPNGLYNGVLSGNSWTSPFVTQDLIMPRAGSPTPYVSPAYPDTVGQLGNERTLWGAMYWGLLTGDQVSFTFAGTTTYREIYLLWYTGLPPTVGASTLGGAGFQIDGDVVTYHFTPPWAGPQLGYTNTPGQTGPLFTVKTGSRTDIQEMLMLVVAGADGLTGPPPGIALDPASKVHATDVFTQSGTGWSRPGAVASFTHTDNYTADVNWELVRAPWTPVSADLPASVWIVAGEWQTDYFDSGSGTPYLPPPNSLSTIWLLPDLFPQPSHPYATLV